MRHDPRPAPGTYTLRAYVGEGFDRGVDAEYEQYAGTLSVGLVYTRRGSARFRCGGRECVSQPGDLMLLRPPVGDVVKFGPAPPRRVWQTYWAHFDPRPHWLDWLSWPEVIPGVMRLRVGDDASGREVLGALAALPGVRRHTKRYYEDRRMHAIEAVLLACRMINPNEHAGDLDPRFVRVADYLDQHFDRVITLANLAKLASLSGDHLEAVFTRYTGTTPMRYLESRRMQSAIEQLHRTDRPVKEIARSVGYADPFYFSNRFRGYTGKSPREFREISREKMGELRELPTPVNMKRAKAKKQRPKWGGRDPRFDPTAR